MRSILNESNLFRSLAGKGQSRTITHIRCEIYKQTGDRTGHDLPLTLLSVR